eukprot:TRINITY_DN1715_c0_g4_i1.p1 TRINITY_DN1715_c0_g4~~TRINITY_DN1715_c0_g4_i1.p1  ORF type:complete len:534 (+),score=146.98 TRINITY_DN1715_c0_g4_i1:145-1746(+)
MSADVKREKVTALVEELKGSSAAQKRLLEEISIVKEHMQSNSGAVKDSYNVLQGALQPLLKELNTKNLVLDKLLQELEDKRDLVQVLRRDLTAAEEMAKNAQKASCISASVSTSHELDQCSREQIVERLLEAERAASNNFKVAEDTQQRLYSVNNEILRMKDKQLTVGVLREGLTDQANYIIQLQGELRAMKKRFQKAREVAVAQEKVIVAMEKQDKEKIQNDTPPRESTPEPASKEASAVIGALRMKLATLQQKEREMQDRSRETEEEWSKKNQHLITQIGSLTDNESQNQETKDVVTEGLIALASELDLQISAQQTFRQSSPKEQIDVLTSLIRTSAVAIKREKYKTAVDLSISTNETLVGVLKAARDRYNQLSNKVRILQQDADSKRSANGGSEERERVLRIQSLKDVREIERLKAQVQRMSAAEESSASTPTNGKSAASLSRELEAAKMNISVLEQQAVERERSSAAEISRLKLQLAEQRALVMSLKPPSPAPVADVPERRRSVTVAAPNPVATKKKLDPIVPKHRFQS